LSFRTGPGDDSGNTNQNSGQHTRTNIQKRLKEALNKDLPSPQIELEDKLNIELTPREIELFEEKSKLITEVKSGESIKGKEVLTSPSLEDLNNKAAES
jgi:hypothetical protein